MLYVTRRSNAIRYHWLTKLHTFYYSYQGTCHEFNLSKVETLAKHPIRVTFSCSFRMSSMSAWTQRCNKGLEQVKNGMIQHSLLCFCCAFFFFGGGRGGVESCKCLFLSVFFCSGGVLGQKGNFWCTYS